MAEEKLQHKDVPESVTNKSDSYEQTDVFQWANNMVPLVDDLKIQLYFFTRKMVPYRVKLSGAVSRQLRPLFIDEILEYVLGGIDKGLLVRDFEAAESEDNVLQRTRTKNVDSLMELLGWLKTQSGEIEEFNEEEHDLKRIKGVVAHCSHKDLKNNFYVIKSLPTSQLMKGNTAWLLKDGVFAPFDKLSALKIPNENQLLVVAQDVFVFKQTKLKQLFGYDAKMASIAAAKAKQIEEQFNLSFPEGVGLQALIKGRASIIKKLQQIEPGSVRQTELLDHAEEMGLELMTDDSGAIIIMDEKDLSRFVNLLNDDYMESNMTGLRYEISKKKPLKPPTEDT